MNNKSLRETLWRTRVRTSGRKTRPKHPPSLIGLEGRSVQVLFCIGLNQSGSRGEETKSIKREAKCIVVCSNYNVVES